MGWFTGSGHVFPLCRICHCGSSCPTGLRQRRRPCRPGHRRCHRHLLARRCADAGRRCGERRRRAHTPRVVAAPAERATDRAVGWRVPGPAAPSAVAARTLPSGRFLLHQPLAPLRPRLLLSHSQGARRSLPYPCPTTPHRPAWRRARACSAHDATGPAPTSAQRPQCSAPSAPPPWPVPSAPISRACPILPPTPHHPMACECLSTTVPLHSDSSQ